MIHRNSSLLKTPYTPTDEITVEQVRGCCEITMGLSDIFPIFIVAGALWVLVYCILMTQKIFMDTQYQEIQPKPHGEDDEEHPPRSPRGAAGNQVETPTVEKENHKHDHNERTFFAYYL